MNWTNWGAGEGAQTLQLCSALCAINARSTGVAGQSDFDYFLLQFFLSFFFLFLFFSSSSFSLFLVGTNAYFGATCLCPRVFFFPSFLLISRLNYLEQGIISVAKNNHLHISNKLIDKRVPNI